MRVLICLILLGCTYTYGQNIKVLTSATKTSIRGLSVVNERVIWVSGSSGTVGRSLDSGITWKWFAIKGFEKADFRDIEAFDATTAVIMAVAEPAYILKTIDGGETWKKVYENKTKGMFLDAMEFWNEQSGIAIGDPINNKFFILRTFDGGDTWREIPQQNLPKADSGEACFASSGTNVRNLAKDEACFVSGGLSAHLFIRNQKYVVPIVQGKETTGANSVAVKNKHTLIVVGGDFNTPDSNDKNCAITFDGGKTWKLPKVSPHGYRSCVEYLGKKRWICCGLNGVDYSTDDGNTWLLISKESYHVCLRVRNANTVFLAGNNRRIAKLDY